MHDERFLLGRGGRGERGRRNGHHREEVGNDVIAKKDENEEPRGTVNVNEKRGKGVSGGAKTGFVVKSTNSKE